MAHRLGLAQSEGFVWSTLPIKPSFNRARARALESLDVDTRSSTQFQKAPKSQTIPFFNSVRGRAKRALFMRAPRLTHAVLFCSVGASNDEED